tara:strand:- start:617 stop:790 length:174 start_codon:yes stop_codon:yes gene_type:complete
MNSQEQTLKQLEETVDCLETLDLSFLFGETKSDIEYCLNEIIIDIQNIQSTIEGNAG